MTTPTNLSIGLQPKQRLVYEMVEDAAGPSIIGIGGSKGSTKSHAMRAAMLLRRLKYPGTAGLLFRRKWNQLRDTHLEGGYFRTWPFMRDWWKASEKTLYLPTNPPSRIVFGVGEHPGDIDDFQGKEFMDVMVDEATRLTEMELVKLNETRRWTGKVGGKSIPDKLCKTVWAMNPGGPGHAYIRRLMFKRDYHGKERAQDYSFMPMYAWDNIEWCRTALLERHLCQCDYYGCLNDRGRRVVEFGGACTFGHPEPRSGYTDKERFEFFIKNTQRGHELDNLPQRLRTGWLLGNWDEFAGQFYDIWDPAKFVKRCLPDRDWHPRWLGIDWGFQHPMSCHWMARVGPVTRIYRELMANHHSARAQAQEIVDRTDKAERKLIDAIYLSPDAFQNRSEQDSFAAQMGDIFTAAGMPYPTPADDDRQHGAQALYEGMRAGELEIDPSCTGLIEVIPMVTTEEDDPEKIEKFEGDDAFDSCFVAGTLIRTERGLVPIEDVTVQDRVLTRIGYKRVLSSGMTNPEAHVWTLHSENRALTGTANHPIYTSQGFRSLISLRYGMMLSCEENWLSLRDEPITGIPTVDGSIIDGTSGVAGVLYTGTSTQAFTAPYRPDMMSITSMEILSTTPIATSKPNWLQSISLSISRSVQRLIVYASNAAKSSKLLILGEFGSVPISVSPHGDVLLGLITFRSLVNAARQYSHPTATMKSASVHASVLGLTGVIHAQPVYNLEVEDAHEYFANGILVHNCRYGYKSRQRAGVKPVAETVHEKVLDFAKARGKRVEDMDVNTIAMLNRRATAAEKTLRGRRRGGLGRVWRPRTAGGVA